MDYWHRLRSIPYVSSRRTLVHHNFFQLEQFLQEFFVALYTQPDLRTVLFFNYYPTKKPLLKMALMSFIRYEFFLRLQNDCINHIDAN